MTQSENNSPQVNSMTYRTALQVALVQGSCLKQTVRDGERSWKFNEAEVREIPGIKNLDFHRTYSSIDEAVDSFARAVQGVNVQDIKAA